MNKGPEVKETAFLYFPISLFACSHNTCDREANNQICGKYREAGSFTSYYIGSATDNNNTARTVLIKPRFLAFASIVLAVLFIIVEKPV